MIKIYNYDRELVAEVTREDYLEFGITESNHYAVVDEADEAESNYIGTLNGFYSNPPAEYTEHLEKCKDVRKYSKNLGNCYKEYYCPLCGVTYRVDSGD